MTPARRTLVLRYLRHLGPPLVVMAALFGGLAWALFSRLNLQEEADEDNLREWLDEALVFRKTLPELVREYLKLTQRHRTEDLAHDDEVRLKHEEIREQLKALGIPMKMYPGQLPLFPVVYRLEIRFRPTSPDLELPPILWDSELPRDRERVRTLIHPMLGKSDLRAELRLEYQLHAYTYKLQEAAQRKWLLQAGVIGLALVALLVTGGFAYRVLRREHERETHQLLAQQEVEKAQKQSLENELHRQEAERRREEVERKLLEQRVAAQEAERREMEVKSQLYASIGIMAGSYAHNIKNLLVRPNDLLRRCLDTDGLRTDQQHMLEEVRGTLHTVTERLQQILKTVRSDPTRAQLVDIDLNAIVRELHQAWETMAQEKWKLTLTVELWPEPLWVRGDHSHLMQAIENLLFNSRDATFEMRTELRERARRDSALTVDAKKRALITAAGWKGAIVLRTLRADGHAVLEVTDNGIGMSPEIQARCTEPHFSTKRGKAEFEGISTGMGLGLSFVKSIADHHHARLEIDSKPAQGATFRLAIPLAPSAKASAMAQAPTV